MILFQHGLSLYIKNTFITIAIGLFFSVTSIFTVFLKVGDFIPYSYVLKFMLYGTYIDKLDILNFIIFIIYILLGGLFFKSFCKKDII